MHKSSILAGLLALPFAVSTACAQDADALRISGFGTAALTWTDTNEAYFARPNQSAGAGTAPRTGVDSNLGLQADYRINDWLSVTGQGLVSKAGEDDYGADLAWAFAKASLADGLSVRVGRIGLPVFMISDYRNVGYANTMLRPSQEVYSQVPASHVDGGDVTWQRSVAGTDYTVQLAFGRTKDGPAVISGQQVLNVVAEHGPLTLRFGHAAGTLALTVPVPLPDGRVMLLALPAQKVHFVSVGAALDWHGIVAQSEVARTCSIGGAQISSSYVMAGYRFGKLLPFYNHGKLTGTSAQSTDTLGLRWDAFRSAAIKVQFDRVTPQGRGLFVQARPGFHGPVTVGAAGIDFVF